MSYQYDSLLSELGKYFASVKRYGIAITKVDSIEADQANTMIENFLSHIGIKHNRLLERFNINADYYSYGAEDESMPRFVLPISSVSHINMDSLKYILQVTIKEGKEAR
jgi:GTP-binding protein